MQVMYYSFIIDALYGQTLLASISKCWIPIPNPWVCLFMYTPNGSRKIDSVQQEYSNNTLSLFLFKNIKCPIFERRQGFAEHHIPVNLEKPN